MMNDQPMIQTPQANLPTGARLACVQHGDFAEALRLIAAGEPEPYFGMNFSVNMLQSLASGCQHLILSLDAPATTQINGKGRIVGLPYPKLPRPIPGRYATAWRVRHIVRSLKAFRPTHLLLRTGGQTALGILDAMRTLSPSTLVIFANVFTAESAFDERVLRRLGQRLNDKHVRLIGNHRWPATRSMLEWGVDESKCQAWDWPGVRRPEAFTVKTLSGHRPYTVFYAGTVSHNKGVGDLIEAVSRLRDRVIIVIAGSGPDTEVLQARARELGVEANWLGRVGNDQVFNRMLAADVVCVPSRPEFREGMPLTLTESLASRTPVVCSDHPVFIKAFVDGEGVAIFKAKQPESLAQALERVLGSADTYHELSDTTAAAFARVDCKTTFGDLIVQWSTMH